MVVFRTYQPKEKEIKHDWHLIDAKNEVLGRIASQITRLLIGKHKPNFVPHLDMGDWVVVINAKDIKVTGKKEKQKIYYRHSGYPGGLKATPLGKVREEHPERLISLAVTGMLPKNRLRARRLARLKVFGQDQHPYKDKFSTKQ